MLILSPSIDRLARRALVAGVALAAAGAFFGSSAAPASAYARIQQSANYMCSDALVRVAPPRVWASGNRPVQAVWVIQLQRWNGSRWTDYSRSNYWAMFDYFGRSPTSWSMFATRTGGRYINSRMNVPVRYRGYYRVASAVNAGGSSSAVWVGGARNHCFMP